MKPVLTAIFDLDGTLLNTLDDIADSMNAALAACGLPVHPARDYRLLVGRGVSNLVRAACPPETDGETLARVGALYARGYAEGYLNKTRAYEGAEAMLRALTEDGAALAVLSNKPHGMTVRMISECFPSIRFAAVFG